MKKKKIIIPVLLVCISLQGFAQHTNDSTWYAQPVHGGQNMAQRLEESTASVSIVYNEEFNKRSAKDISNSLFGQGLGLNVFQASGNYADYEPSFNIRGLQTLSSNTPLILVDGIERDMSFVTPEEVESVTILKDAARIGRQLWR